MTDSQFFLNSCYTGTHNFNGNIERCPAWRHLKDFLHSYQENIGPADQRGTCFRII
ncbi:hypothetical protein [Flavobacterium ginsenosidimutans]|uniref:hypothetical protein n=1 Tax=Flavobacterium ginsenosidimutans TaxID=687844 RepID=UPI003BB03FBB